MALDALIKPGAEADLAGAFSFYEQCERGLGWEFISCVESKIFFIQEHPNACPVKHAGFRRALIAKFPFGLYYKEEASQVVVFAILDLRQSIKKIEERLREQDVGGSL